MDLRETSQEAAFRQEVRAFVQKHLPAKIRRSVMSYAKLNKSEISTWHKILHEHGWGAPGWPKKYGGTGWSPSYRRIFDEETYRGGAPRLMPFVNMIGPILQHYGTPDQKERFLPPILWMDEWWCQGYSEPEAGSDLASLRTSARRNGENFIVSGQKLWTSFAAWADWMFALVRTSTEEKRQAGITFLLIDMNSPRITVRPIPTLNGDDDIAEVLLDEVVVPVENVVGEIGEGWTIAKHLLGHERAEVALVGHNKRLIDRVRRAIIGSGISEQRRCELRRNLARLEIRLTAQDWLLSQILSGGGDGSNAKVSILKLQGVEIAQELVELLLEAHGPAAISLSKRSSDYLATLTEDPDANFGASELYFDARRHSIYGGTTEIQKTIVARELLGI